MAAHPALTSQKPLKGKTLEKPSVVGTVGGAFPPLNSVPLTYRELPLVFTG